MANENCKFSLSKHFNDGGVMFSADKLGFLSVDFGIKQSPLFIGNLRQLVVLLAEETPRNSVVPPVGRGQHKIELVN